MKIYKFNKQRNVNPPIAEKITKELNIHGHTRIDNYYWLNERKNPKVIEYLNAENDYTRSIMKNTEDLQKKLYKEIIGRIKQNDESVPYLSNGYYYYTRYEKGNEHPIYCRKKDNLDNKEEIILNVNEMAKGHDYFYVNTFSVSPDNKIIAYGLDTVSRRQYFIYFKNLETRETYPHKIHNTTGSVAWANDNKTIFYTKKDPKTLRSFKIFKHILGQETIKDIEIYYEDDETFSTEVYKTRSKKFIIIASYSTISNEYRILDANDPKGIFTVFQKREPQHEYFISHGSGKFYVVTNLNAKNFRLMETSENKTTKENWQEVISHRDDVLIEDIEVFKNFVVVEERKNGLVQFRIINQKKKNEHYIDFEEEAYDAYTSTNYEFDTEILRYKYTSMTNPISTYDYNIQNKEKVLRKQQEVLGDFNATDYYTERHYTTARDGMKIPISLVYKKGLKKDGKNPLLLYGYGSYGYTIDPGFSSARLSLLERGFVFAIAHIRGSQTLGRSWYEQGKILKKKNTFTDFIDCAEYLIKENFTNSEKLFAMGGSAGGLLIGAVVNMKPQLFKGAIAAVPFVDVVTTMLDKSIPLTTSEYDEWGNPNNKEHYDYILSYSPYDNVAVKNYPHMLVTTGLHDSQVQYWEPAKWIAKLRAFKKNDNILLLHTDIETGHSGASGRFKPYKEIAMEYAFLLACLYE